MFKINFKAVLLIAVIGVFSCKKTKTADPVTRAPEEQTEHLAFSFTNVANGKAISYSTIYTTDDGARYNLNSLRYYVSGIRLVKEDGSEYKVADKYLLVDAAIPNYDLGHIPLGSYQGIRFNIGVDSLTNHKDPTIYPATHPLAIQTPVIHWSWNSGYIFLMLEGSCDTTSTNTDLLNGVGEFNHPLFYHIGLDRMYKNVSLDTAPFKVVAGAENIVRISADLNKFLKGVNIKTQNGSHTMGTVPLATTLAGNIPTMFSVSQ